jgi:hypothetical protein
MEEYNERRASEIGTEDADCRSSGNWLGGPNPETNILLENRFVRKGCA